MKRIVTAVIILFFTVPVFAAGPLGPVLPVIEINQELIGFSPISSPGVKDKLDIPLSITADTSRRLVIKSFVVTISDVNGKVVRTLTEKDQSGDPDVFTGLFISFGWADKPQLNVPQSIQWDGRDEQGNILTDGNYTYAVSATDDKGRTGASEEDGNIVIDNTIPDVSAVLGAPVFSPNGDGQRDTLEITQSGSVEDIWTMTFENEFGEVVFTKTIENAAPGSFEWDGFSEDGSPFADGVYTYTITSTDAAGNTTTVSLPPVRLDTLDRGGYIDITNRAFSPNGDGRKDFTVLTLTDLTQDGLLSYKVVLYNADEEEIEVLDEGNTFLQSYTFNGYKNNGIKLADGEYYIEYQLSFDSGSKPAIMSDVIYLDTVAPQASAGFSEYVFSPTGNGMFDTVTLEQTAENGYDWIAELRNETNSIVGRFNFPEGFIDEMTFDSSSYFGKSIPEGKLSYVLTAEDEAGNVGTSDAAYVIVDYSDYDASLTASNLAFSPNGDGRKDDTSFYVDSNRYIYVNEYEYVISDVEGKEVDRVSSESEYVLSTAWDGKKEGELLPEGRYSVTLLAKPMKGGELELTLEDLVIDVTAPSIKLETASKRLSANGDNVDDTFVVNQQSSDEDLWTAEIRGVDAGLVWVKQWEGIAGKAEWDGLNQDKEPVPVGLYTYKVHSTDAAGNIGFAEINEIYVNPRFMIPYTLVGGKAIIDVEPLIFTEYSADLTKSPKAFVQRNRDSLDQIVDLLEKDNRAIIYIEGHGLNVYYGQDNELFRSEEVRILELSESRAEAVMEALKALGVDPRQLKIRARGGKEPANDISNRTLWWESRRVQFILSNPNR